MSVPESQTGQHEKLELREMPPPVEPRLAYPEPHLSSSEILALIRGKTFLAANRMGDVMPPGHPHVGLFRDDTRYLSRLELLINGHPPAVLSSTTEGAYATHVEMTVESTVHVQGLDFPVNSVYVRREQVLEDETLYDVFRLQSFHAQYVPLRIEVTYGADFMDIFQVRGIIRGKSGRYYEPVAIGGRMIFLYQGLDHSVRSTTISFQPQPTKIAGQTASWDIELAPFCTTQITCTIVPQAEGKNAPAAISELIETIPAVTTDHNLEAALGGLDRELESWKKDCTRFRSDNDIFNNMLSTASLDFHALQIRHAGNRAIAAGVPWFATIFGRDSLIASYETLILNPTLARGTLRVLAAHQGLRQSDENDEDPGKILHELRSGEMTATGEVAFGRNYGSVDATPLFLILLSEYFRWSADLEFLREMEPHLRASIDWLIEYGDLDGDGLIEFRRRSPKGLFNQGWKDSGDANMHADGRIAQPPIALVEVQGYAADAYARASVLFRALGSDDRAEVLSHRSRELRRLLDRAFWMPETNYYAMALDRDKEQLKVLASNPGHLLFANAIDLSRAAQVVRVLMASGLNSGWGIRTLSNEELTFNPMSYHRGSVWPHDSALIAYGMANYGFLEESSHICSCLYEAALHFRDYRLPELFCGIQRSRHDEPVHYPVSCSPQAWASGAMFLMLTALLGINVDAPHCELKIVNPRLPEFLSQLAVDGLQVGKSRVWLEFQRHEQRTFCNVSRREGEEISISVIYR